jgi:hypothetical protein
MLPSYTQHQIVIWSHFLLFNEMSYDFQPLKKIMQNTFMVENKLKYIYLKKYQINFWFLLVNGNCDILINLNYK